MEDKDEYLDESDSEHEEQIDESNEEEIIETIGNNIPVPPPIPSLNNNNDAPSAPVLDLSNLNQNNLRRVALVEKKMSTGIAAMDTRNELESRLAKRAQKNVEPLKEEIRALVERFQPPHQFYSFEEVRKVLQSAAALESKLANVSNHVLWKTDWPQEKIAALKILNTTLLQIEKSLKFADQVLSGNNTNLNGSSGNVRKGVMDSIQVTMQELLQAEQALRSSKGDTQAEGIIISESCFTELAEKTSQKANLLWIKYATIAMDKFSRIMTSKSKFDLNFQVNHVHSVMQAALNLLNQFKQEYRQHPLKNELQVKLATLVTEYSDILNIATVVIGVPSSLKDSAERDTTLHNLVSQGNIQQASVFLKSLASENVQKDIDPKQAILLSEDSRGCTPLWIAINRNLYDMILFLTSEYDPKLLREWKDRARGNSYLHWIVLNTQLATRQKLELVDVFVNKIGFDVDTVNHAQETVSHCVAKSSNAADLQIVKVLITKGANVIMKDQYGKTVLKSIADKYFPSSINVTPVVPGTIQFSRYFNNKTLSDVRFVVENETIPAHKIILCAQSSTFRGMLEGNWKESDQSSIHLTDVKLVPFKFMLEYVYTGETRIPKSDVTLGLELLGLADRFMLEPLRKSCEFLIFCRLGLENAFEIYTNGELYHSKDLKNVASYFILFNYDQIAFADTNQEILISILSSVCDSQ